MFSKIETLAIGDVTVVNFVDTKIMYEQQVQMIGDDLFRLVDELGCRKVLLNYDNVEFMSSALLGKLDALRRKLAAQKGKLVLCRVIHEIMDVFKITRMDRVLTIVTDEQTGLQAFEA